jgi:hypothetical protein
MKEWIVPIGLGAAGLGLALLPNILKARTVAIGPLKVSKYRGDSVRISAPITNTGEIDWTFGIGCSIKDASGQIWDLWNGNISKRPGAGIDSRTITKGQTVTHSWTVTIPSDMAIGDTQIIVAVWKESSLPVSNCLADTGWLSGLLNIAGRVAASIGTISVE